MSPDEVNPGERKYSLDDLESRQSPSLDSSDQDSGGTEALLLSQEKGEETTPSVRKTHMFKWMVVNTLATIGIVSLYSLHLFMFLTTILSTSGLHQ